MHQPEATLLIGILHGRCKNPVVYAITMYETDSFRYKL